MLILILWWTSLTHNFLFNLCQSLINQLINMSYEFYIYNWSVFIILIKDISQVFFMFRQSLLSQNFSFILIQVKISTPLFQSISNQFDLATVNDLNEEITANYHSNHNKSGWWCSEIGFLGWFLCFYYFLELAL